MSLEDRRLLNPAFGGLLVLRAAQGFHKESDSGLPFILAYLVLPLVLHPETRDRIPQAIVSKLITWTERNGDLVTLLPRRTAELASTTGQSLFIISSAKAVNIGPRGELVPHLTENRVASFERSTASDEVRMCARKAQFVGRWFATSGTVPTILTSLGIQL